MEYNIISQCGASETTTAYKARVKKSLSFVCIKKRPRPGPVSLDSLVALHRSLPTHPNILPLLAYYATPRNIYRVYEYAPGGCLRSIITSDKGLPEGALRLFGCDLVRLLHHVHSSGIALGALSPEALFLDEDGTVKLGNVKGAARVPARYDSLGGYSLAYTAPEYLVATSGSRDGWLTQAGDLWSLGVCLWELACGTKPAWKEGGGGVGGGNASSTTKGTLLWDTLLLPDPGRLQWGGEHPTGGDIDAPPPPPIPRIPPSTELHSLLLGLLHPSPTLRLTWQGVLSHPFWDGVQDLPTLPPPLFPLGIIPGEKLPSSQALAAAPLPTPSTTLTPSSSLESGDAQATVGEEIMEGSGKRKESIKEEEDSTIPSESSSTNTSWVAPQGMELSSALRYSVGLTNFTAAQHHSTFISTSSTPTPIHPSSGAYVTAAVSPPSLSIGLPISGGNGGGGGSVGVGGIDATNGTLSTSARERERLELPAAPSASTWSLPLASAVLAFRVTPLALGRSPPQNPGILPFTPPPPPSHPLPPSLFPALVSALSLPGDPLVQLSTLAYLLKDPNALQSVCNDLLSLPSFLTALASLLSPHSTTAAVNSRAAQVLSALIQGASELRAEVVLPVLPKALMRCVSETTSASARQSAAGALAELIYYRAVGVVEEEEEEGGEVEGGWDRGDTTTATTTMISPWRFHPSLWTFLIKHTDAESEADGVVRNTFLQCIGNCCIAAPRALLPSSSLPVEEEGWDGDFNNAGNGGGSVVPDTTWELLASLSGASQQSNHPLVWEKEEEGTEPSTLQPFSNMRFKAVLLLTAALTCHPLSGKEDTVAQLAECAISGLQGSGVAVNKTAPLSPPAVALALLVASTMKGFNGSSRLMVEGGKWSGVVGRLCNACVSAASSSSSSSSLSSPASSAATTLLPRDSIIPLAATCALLGLWGVERGGASKIPSSHLLSCIPPLLTLLGKHPYVDSGVELGESGGVLALPSLFSSLSRTFVLAAAALPSIPPSLPPCIDALLGLEGALRGEALGKALVNSTLGTPTQSPLLGRAVLKALAQGLECDFDPPPSLLALAARALALYGAVVRLHKDDTGFGGSGGGDVSILLPPHTFGSVDDTRGTWGVHQGGSATAIAALLAACIPPLKRHFMEVSLGAKGGEDWGVKVANSAWPYLNLAFTLLALPQPPLDAFASPQHFASTLCSDMLLPTLALHAALGLDGKGGSVRPPASSSTPPPPSSFLLLRSALVELTTQVLRRCKALGVISHVLATTPHLPHALLATAAREASWWGDGSASLLGGMEVLSASLDATAHIPSSSSLHIPPPLSWRTAAYDYGVGTLMLSAVAAGVQSAGRGEGGNELVQALTLIERFLEGSVIPDVLGEEVEGGGEGARGEAHSADPPLPSKRISLDKLLTSLLHLPPLLALLLNWCLSSPLEIREQLAGLGGICGNILGSLALAHPVDTGFSLLDWSQQAQALCEALTPGFLPPTTLQQALSHPSLSLLVTTVAEYECSEHVITALCCVVEACDDARAVAVESMDWGAAAAATGLSASK